MAQLSVGDPAPDFDLTSTEDVVLMLRDEVPRSAVLLYFFGDPAGARARGDLQALARERAALEKAGAKVFAVSPAKLDELKTAQRELGLPYPLLSDDRGFARRFGFAGAGEGDGEGAAEPVLVLVDRDQKVLWQAAPLGAVAPAIGEVKGKLGRLGSSTANYPRSVINRLVDLWVN